LRPWKKRKTPNTSFRRIKLFQNKNLSSSVSQQGGAAERVERATSDGAPSRTLAQKNRVQPFADRKKDKAALCAPHLTYTVAVGEEETRPWSPSITGAQPCIKKEFKNQSISTKKEI